MTNRMMMAVLLGATMLTVPASAASKMESKMTMPDMASVQKMTADWPAKVRDTIEKTTQLYGQPTDVGTYTVAWHNEDLSNAKLGPFKSVIIRREEFKHDFPVTHTDFMTHTVAYKISSDRATDLTAFDGSVTYDRTTGQLSATCDTVGHNLLALNLANDIFTGKKSVNEARQFYAMTVMQEKKGEMPAYEQKLMFTPPSNGADSDENVESAM